ncbi:GDSL esterase/lipase [Acorus gramineus]|uniref:GDSL esterase/lipase n=1 Tax=Acorus gramineus TaxID=55184 RepID=A0AAV9BQB2_ACOGR|nr:GDSL esterase/lipase [Acorus gramineus]
MLWFTIHGGFLLDRCSADAITASFCFGDSLVDTGNNNYIVSLSKANYVPNGIDFPSSRPTGRYTNGRTIPDIIGQEMGLKSFTPPYLAPTTSGAVVLHGVNYASGGGGILNHTGKIFGGRINLDAQIDNYANTRNDIISSIGEARGVNLLRKSSLFSIVIGSNDFINNYLLTGFDVADSACCYVAGRFGGLVPCGPPSKVCPDRSKFVFWDPYHPSDASNKIIASRLMDGDSNDVFPMNVRKLARF